MAPVGEILPDFVFSARSGGSQPLEEHFRLGRELGGAHRAAIQERMAAHARGFGPFLASAKGREVLAAFLATHRREVPQLVRELEGLASGSGVAFEVLFAASLEEEIGYFYAPRRARSDRCSDYMLCTAQRCLNGHNEDGDAIDGRMYFAFVQMGSANFTTLNYVGDLLGGMSALAFNSHGIAFSLNWVGPGTCDVAGLGRNYISRLLLEASSLEEAIATVSRKHAAGHNYQVMDFVHRRIVNVEVAHDMVSVRPINQPFFHANQYQTLQVPDQVLLTHSRHRLERVKHLPLPANASDVLRILGDQEDHEYPIFHDDASHARGDLADWTLASALFDLDDGSVALMQGNPARGVVWRTLTVPRSAPSSANLLSV